VREARGLVGYLPVRHAGRSRSAAPLFLNDGAMTEKALLGADELCCMFLKFHILSCTEPETPLFCLHRRHLFVSPVLEAGPLRCTRSFPSSLLSYSSADCTAHILYKSPNSFLQTSFVVTLVLAVMNSRNIKRIACSSYPKFYLGIYTVNPICGNYSLQYA
jgi:hypothetical protein